VPGQQAASRPAATADRHRELGAPPHPCPRGKHQPRPLRSSPPLPRSGAQPLAPLAPARGQHRPPSAGPHAQAEPVRLRTAAVVRLKSTLAHFWLQMRCSAACAPPARRLLCLPPATLTPHRPGSRIGTAPARGPVNQPKCPDPAGQTGGNRPTSARPGTRRGTRPDRPDRADRADRGACLPGAQRTGGLPEHCHLPNAPLTGRLGCGEPYPVRERGHCDRDWAHETTQSDQTRGRLRGVQPVDRLLDGMGARGDES
jgi:hypothetical protein